MNAALFAALFEREKSPLFSRFFVAFGHRHYRQKEMLEVPIQHVNGTALYYEAAGRGTPLLFIHGQGLTHAMFQPQIEYFKSFYRVIAVDLRGNGQSGKLQVPDDQVIETQCEDLSLLLGYLGIRRAVLIGADYGGILAQRFAYLYPDQVCALIVADSTCNNLATSFADKTLVALAAMSRLTYYLPGEFFLRTLKAMYHRWDLAYQNLRKGLLQKRTSELLKQSRAASRIDFTGILPRIQVPAFCLAGDQAEADIRHMRETARLLPRGRFEVIEDAIHLSNLCQPIRFNERIKHFLEEERI